MRFRLVEDYENFDWQDYLTTVVPSGSTYIITSGEFVDLYGGTHGASEMFFDEANVDTSILADAIILNDATNSYDPIPFPYMYLPKKLTLQQYDSLLKWLDNLPKDTEVEVNGIVRYSLKEYLPEDIIKKIKRFYSSGVLYEKLNNNLYHAYHGSRSDFERFEYQYIGSHGLENGYGLYFADDKDVAQSYGDYIIEADLLIRKPFSDDEITITKDQTKEYIRKYVDSDGEGFLTDYGWYKDEGYENILNKAVDAMFTYNQSDNDIISEILPPVKNKFSDEAYDAIFDIFGKDGIIYTGYSTWDGSPITNYIVYSNNQVLNKRKIKKV